MTGFGFVSQPVTVGNTFSFDTGLSNAVTIEKCTFLESDELIVDVRSPYAPPSGTLKFQRSFLLSRIII